MLKPSNKAHVTNECHHIFHTDWLENWYYFTKPGGELVCPICRTVNSPATTKRNPLSDQIDSLSVGEDSFVFRKTNLKILSFNARSATRRNEDDYDYESKSKMF